MLLIARIIPNFSSATVTIIVVLTVTRVEMILEAAVVLQTTNNEI